MALTDALINLPFYPFFESVVPDLLLGFAFFAALCYAVLGRHFGQQRPAAAMSAALGLALAMGLVWWEAANHVSVRNLGPLALGLLVVVFAGVVFQAVRHVGGGWAGGGFAVALALFMGWLLGGPMPVARGLVQAIAIVAFLVGVAAWLVHGRREIVQAVPVLNARAPMRDRSIDVVRDGQIADRLASRLADLRSRVGTAPQRPEFARDVMERLQQILPDQGVLTRRLAELRRKIRLARDGHAHRINELAGAYARVPPEARARINAELRVRWAQFRLDERLERLNRAAAENERRIADLIRQARQWLAAGDRSRLVAAVNAAAALQQHNARLIRAIERTEEQLLSFARQATQATGGVRPA